MADKELTNIQVYRKRWNFNIGIILFGVIFIYLVVTVLLYLTDKQVSAYEVREGSILRDTAYTGLVLRDETIVNADEGGYINYFAIEGNKVGSKTRVYSLSDKELEFDETVDEEELKNLTAEEQATLLMQTQSFSEDFNEQQFSDVYSFKDSINTVLESKSNQSRQAQLDEMLASDTGNLQIYNASIDGIISYATDGYEGITLSDVTPDMLSKSDYEKQNFRNNMEVKAGDPIYKIVRNDTWTVVIPLSHETAQEMAETTSVRVRFSKDGETATARFEIYNTEDADMGFLTFDNSMVRYIDERFLDIQLILEDESGLKIPKSSVVTKDFYLIPKDYVTQGGNGKEPGVLVDTGKDDAKFQAVTVYYEDEEAGMSYLETDAFEEGTILKKENSVDTFTISEKGKLEGVYNINKGYAVFKQISILCESEDYYIVQLGNAYGLSNYDHIALTGKDVRENDIVF